MVRSSQIGNEMDEAERESFLASNNHGVLSMGVDDRGYGVPMAYHYERGDARIVLGFVDAAESKKSEFAAATDQVTLTVYEYRDVDDWASVVVTGELRPPEEADLPDRLNSVFFVRDDESGDGDDRIVAVDQLERERYELLLDDVSGRHSGG